ncbi:MAG: glycosyltransferase, partial [Sulfitobacter sp.]
MALDAESEAIGSLLLDRGALTAEQLDAAEDLAEDWNVSLVKVLLSRRWLTTQTLYREIAFYHGLTLVDLIEDRADDDLIRRYDPVVMNQFMTVPIGRAEDGTLTVATSRPGPRTLLHIREVYGTGVTIVVASHFDVSWQLQRAFREKHSHEAVFALAELDPDMSAQNVVTPPQILVIYLLVSALLLG